MDNRFGTLQGVTLVLLRVFTGLLFAQHGAQKLLGWFGGVGPEGGTVGLVSLMGLAGVLELFGGLIIALGLFTRPVAFILAGEMTVAYLMAHLPQGFWPIENGGERALLFLFIFLYLAFRGAGSFSLDAWRAGRRRISTAP